MPICTFLVIGTFNESEIRRRLYFAISEYSTAIGSQSHAVVYRNVRNGACRCGRTAAWHA